MPRRATDGASLEQLIELAIPLCQDAQRQCPRTGPGRKPTYDDWKIVALILCGVLKKKKSIGAQYTFLVQNQRMLLDRLELQRLPSRSSFYDRYKGLGPILQRAITLQGQQAIQEGVANPRDAAIDKSLLAARGPQWNQKDRKRGHVPPGLRGLDRQADWGVSDYHGWVYGYSYEAVVTATPGSIVFPLLASVDVASMNEHNTVRFKIRDLPKEVRNLLADRDYDSNDAADAFELDPDERPTGRRYVCPTQRDFVSDKPEKGRRERQRRRRVRRHGFVKSEAGQKLYQRRGRTIEPFNGSFKEAFELNQQVWHRGLKNNQTQVLCAIFAYQLLIRWNCKQGQRNAQIRYLLDGL